MDALTNTAELKGLRHSGGLVKSLEMIIFIHLEVVHSSSSVLIFSQNKGYSEISEQRTLWDQYKFKWFVPPCIEVVLFKRFQSHYIDREGIKFGDLVLSIVERYLIQCPFLGVSVKRGSTVEGEGVVGSLHHCSSAAPTLSARDGEHNISFEVDSQSSAILCFIFNYFPLPFLGFHH